MIADINLNIYNRAVDHYYWYCVQKGMKACQPMADRSVVTPLANDHWRVQLSDGQRFVYDYREDAGMSQWSVN